MGEGSWNIQSDMDYKTRAFQPTLVSGVSRRDDVMWCYDDVMWCFDDVTWCCDDVTLPCIDDALLAVM